MDLTEKLIIKVQFNDEIRKMPVHNEDITYDELLLMMERVFKHKLTQSDDILIRYKDEDGDLITITDDSDLTFAIESCKILKLILTVQNDSAVEEAKERDLSPIELNSIRKELQIIRDHATKVLDKLMHFNGDSLNVNPSGRASATADFHGVGGKEFDPLSITSQSQFQSVDRVGSASSLVSSSRTEEVVQKIPGDFAKPPPQEIHSNLHEIQKPLPMHSFPKNQAIPNVSGDGSVPLNVGPNMAPPSMPPFQPQPQFKSSIPSTQLTGSQSMPPPMNIAAQYQQQQSLPMGGILPSSQASLIGSGTQMSQLPPQPIGPTSGTIPPHMPPPQVASVPFMPPPTTMTSMSGTPSDMSKVSMPRFGFYMQPPVAAGGPLQRQTTPGAPVGAPPMMSPQQSMANGPVPRQIMPPPTSQQGGSSGYFNPQGPSMFNPHNSQVQQQQPNPPSFGGQYSMNK